MADLLHQARRRALQYWAEDGVPDVYAGLLFLLFAGLRLLAQWADLRQQATLRAMAFFGSMAVLLAGALLGRFIIHAVKQRVTYPRTGYVAYTTPSPRERRRQMAFTLLLALLLVGFVLFMPHAGLRFRMWTLHLVLFLVFAALSWPMGHPRYAFYALLVPLLAAGYHLTWAHWPSHLRPLLTYGEITFLVLGVVMMLGGALTLTRYLKAHPILEEAEV